MKEIQDNQYVVLTQKDYSMSFNMGVVKEIEAGEIRIKEVVLKCVSNRTRQ